MKKYKIGSLMLKNRYFLAPMAGVNDIAFRVLCKKAGAGLVYTGMVNPLTKNEMVFDDKPAVQLFAKTSAGVSEFVKKYDNKAVLFDFNLGCPAYLAERHGFGAFLHDKTDVIESILKKMRGATKKPITIKLRKSKEAFKIVKIAEKYCDAITIHPRTYVQGYSGNADVDFALELKKRTSLPIIYSGDVDEKNAKSLLEKFDFVMLGRRAMGDPSIFAKLTKKSGKFGFDEYLKLALKYKLNFSQIKSQAIFFTKYQSGAKDLRRSLVNVKNVAQIRKILC